jgi:hypothetical protein
MSAPMLTCWQCGIAPLRVIEVTQLGDPEPRYIPGRWPYRDDAHDHATEPPSPAQLAAAGDASMARIGALWALREDG